MHGILRKQFGGNNMTKQICHANNGAAPIDQTPLGGPLRNKTPAELSDWIADGWREYVPSNLPNIKSSEWVDTGAMYVQSNVVQYTEQELADIEAAQQAAEAESAAAFKAMQGELDNAQLITKGLALTILDELNRTTQRLRDFDSAVQAATSLADLKTRVGSLLPIPDRTAEQLKAAVKAKVGTL
jgi:hypothetical protein